MLRFKATDADGAIWEFNSLSNIAVDEWVDDGSAARKLLGYVPSTDWQLSLVDNHAEVFKRVYEWANWYAVDSDGNSYCYMDKPIFVTSDDGYWQCDPTQISKNVAYVGKLESPSDSAMTLIARPTDELSYDEISGKYVLHPIRCAPTQVESDGAYRARILATARNCNIWLANTLMHFAVGIDLDAIGSLANVRRKGIDVNDGKVKTRLANAIETAERATFAAIPIVRINPLDSLKTDNAQLTTKLSDTLAKLESAESSEHRDFVQGELRKWENAASEWQLKYSAMKDECALLQRDVKVAVETNKKMKNEIDRLRIGVELALAALK